MSITALYADGIKASIDRQIANPTPMPGASFSLSSFLGAGMKGFPAAGLELGGDVLDLARMVDEDPAEKRRRDRMGVPFLSGNELRAKANDLVDPNTSTEADQVLFGLARVGSKVGLALATATPPVAAALLAAEGTNTAAQNLMAKGVDKDAAVLTGLVEGAGQAAAILPVAGPTAKSTIALGAAGGPGAFMAQESMARRILDRAGYHDEASRHDPLDPLGLSIATLLPGVIGGIHIARMKRPTPMVAPKTEADMKTAATLTPQEQEVSAAFEKSAGNLAELRDAIAKEKRPEARALLEAELETQTSKLGQSVEKHIADRASVTPEIVDAARVRVTQDALHRNLPDVPEAHAEVMRAGDEISAGRMPDVQPIELYHGSPHEFEVFDSGKIGIGEGAQAYGHGLYMAESPGVARSYQHGLTERDFIRKVKDTYDQHDSPSDAAAALDSSVELSKQQRELLAALRDDDYLGFEYPHQAVQAALREPGNFDLSPRTQKALNNFGNLYKTSMPGEMAAKMLDWDKPLGEQAPWVREAIARAGYEPDKYIKHATLGEWISKTQGEGFAEYLAADLRKQGVPGIKYLDGNSRGSGEGTRNYVVFPGEEGNLRITERNGQHIADPLLPGERNPRTNALPEPEALKVAQENHAPKARADDVQAIINARKRQSVLKSLLECLE